MRKRERERERERREEKKGAVDSDHVAQGKLDFVLQRPWPHLSLCPQWQEREGKLRERELYVVVVVPPMAKRQMSKHMTLMKIQFHHFLADACTVSLMCLLTPTPLIFSFNFNASTIFPQTPIHFTSQSTLSHYISLLFFYLDNSNVPNGTSPTHHILTYMVRFT